MKQNKYLTRLRKLKGLLLAKCDDMSMDNLCGGSDLTIDDVITDLDECMKHCNADVDYIPPAYYLKQLNSIYKHYNSKTYAS
jgi:hypothetical protein